MTRLDAQVWFCDVQRSIRCDVGSIIQPLAEFAGPALDILGQPEIGIPLQVATSGAELGQGNIQGGLTGLAGAGLAGAGIPSTDFSGNAIGSAGQFGDEALGAAEAGSAGAAVGGVDPLTGLVAGGESATPFNTASSILPPDVLSQVSPFISPNAVLTTNIPNEAEIFQDPSTITNPANVGSEGGAGPQMVPGQKVAVVSSIDEGNRLVNSGQAENFILDTGGATGAAGTASQTAADAAATAGAAAPGALPTTPSLGATTAGFGAPISGAGGGAAAGAAPLAGAVGETGGALSAGPAEIAPEATGAGSTGLLGAGFGEGAGSTALSDAAVSDILSSPVGGIEPLTGQVAGGESAIPIDQSVLAASAPPTGVLPDLATAGRGILDFIKRNPAVALGAGGIGLSALTRPSIPNLGAMGKTAGQLQTLAAQDINTINTGKLPPGAEQMVQNAVQDAQSGIRSRYASMGLSGSTMEQQDLNAVQERAAATRFQIAEQVTQQGLNAAGLEEQIYAQIAGLVLNQDQGLQNAIAGFSTAAGFGAGLEAVRSA